MTTRLFQRVSRVVISRNQATTDERRFFKPLPDGIEVTQLRTRFEIEKSLEPSPNTCTLQIDNLSPTTRAELQNPGIVVKLEAGYDSAPRHMFVGDLTWARSTQEDNEWVTELALGDGARAYANARRNRSYAGGTQIINVLRDAATSMGVSLPPEIERAPEFREQFSAGFATTGRVRDELTRLLAPYGYGWSIQNGRLQILRDEDALGTSRLVAEETGMIGSPEFDKPAQRKSRRSQKYRGAKATVKMFLYPELTPGHHVEIRSRALNGIFKIYRVKHEGDTHGDPWTTEIEVHA